MIWALLICVMLGVFCGLWLHVVAFTLVTVVVIFVFVISTLLASMAVVSVALSAFYLCAALGAGYVVAHIGLFLYKPHAAASRSKASEIDSAQKYMKD